MRISLALLFAVVLQLPAENGYAQRTHVAISMNNVSVEQILNKIEETSDYVFLYNDKTIQKNRIVSVRNKSGKILDILDDMEEIKVCTGYEYEGKEIEEYPADLKFLEKITPVYKTFKGWKQKISDIRSYDELPALCKEYLEGISKLIGVPIGIVSVGPSREQTIVIKEVF